MELDKAFQFAVILAWEDLTQANQERSVRVEYQGKPGASLDSVSVWSAKAWGYHDLVCGWTSSSPGHSSGACFKNGHGSDKLADGLGFIMRNQDQFTRPADVIDRPAAEERQEAATWMNQVRGSDTNFASAAD